MSREPSFWMKTIATLVGGLFATGLAGIVNISLSTARKVDVLIDRPIPVPLSQYESDMRQLKSEISTIKEEGTATKERVKAIENRQVESLNKYRK